MSDLSNEQIKQILDKSVGCRQAKINGVEYHRPNLREILKLREKCEQQQRELEEAKAEIGSLCGELGDLNHLMQQIEQERDALAAHVERVLDLRDKLNSEQFESCDWFELFDGLMNCIKFQSPQTSLAEVNSRQAEVSFTLGFIDGYMQNDIDSKEGGWQDYKNDYDSFWNYANEFSFSHVANVRNGKDGE